MHFPTERERRVSGPAIPARALRLNDDVSDDASAQCEKKGHPTHLEPQEPSMTLSRIMALV